MYSYRPARATIHHVIIKRRTPAATPIIDHTAQDPAVLTKTINSIETSLTVSHQINNAPDKADNIHDVSTDMSKQVITV